MMFHNDNEKFRHFGLEFVQNILPNFLPQSIFFNNYGAKLSILFFFLPMNEIKLSVMIKGFALNHDKMFATYILVEHLVKNNIPRC